MQEPSNFEAILHAAANSVRQPDLTFRSMVNDLPHAIYVTDPEGVVQDFNQACIAFAGRTPAPGVDSWCVSWKLFTDKGDFLPHDQCPMATAVREKRVVRGAGASAERPDGSRVPFLAFPTPLLDPEGKFIGAINMLVATTEQRRAELRDAAMKCLRLASYVTDPQALAALHKMAAEYEEQASKLVRPN